MKKFTKLTLTLAMLFGILGGVSSVKATKLYANLSALSSIGSNATWNGTTNTISWVDKSNNMVSNFDFAAGNYSSWEKVVVNITSLDNAIGIRIQIRANVTEIAKAFNGTGTIKVNLSDFGFADGALKNVEWIRMLGSGHYDGESHTISSETPGSAVISEVYLEKTDELSIKDADMTCYSFVSYLPLVAGVVFGRLLDLNTLQTAYMAKLCMLIFYVMGVFLAIKTIPKFKYTIAMICMLPMALMYASGISYDGMVIVTTLNFVASLWAFNEKDTRLNLLTVLIWTFLMISCKGGGYIILLPLVFSLKKYKPIILILASALLSLLIFNNFLYADQSMFQLNKNIAGNLYTGWAFEHPLK